MYIEYILRFEKPDDAKYLKTIRDQLEFAEINPRFVMLFKKRHIVLEIFMVFITNDGLPNACLSVWLYATLFYSVCLSNFSPLNLTLPILYLEKCFFLQF